MVRPISSPIGANPTLVSGQQVSTNGVPLSGNSLRTSTSGRARTLSQSNPGWLGSTATVAGSVLSELGQQVSTNGVPLSGNSLRTSTSGRARTLSQSNPGWLGSTATVAGSVLS